MFKKTILPAFILLFALSLNGQANPKKEITMLVVPRDAKTIQIAKNIAEHYPVLIVSYQQTPTQPKLYAWNGEGWVDISVEDYVTGAFFGNPPQHAIIIEPENTPAAEVLVPDGTWCKSGNRLTTTDPRTLIHLLGLYFDFPHRHWRALAKTHRLSVADINPGLVNIAWWQYPEKRPTLDPEDDMDHWLFLDITPPPPVEPVVTEEEPEPILPAEHPAIETDKMPPETAPAEEAPVAKKTIEELIKALEEAAPETQSTVVDPFLATEIPAAEVVLPPTE